MAQKIARALRADLEEIKAPNSYGPGPRGYARALFHSVFQRTPEVQFSGKNLNDYDLVVVGGPVWGSGPAAPVRAFLAAHRGEFKNVAFFASQGGSAGRPRLFRQMESACGKAPLATLAVTERQLESYSFREEFTSFVNRLQGKGEFARQAG